MFSYVRLQWIKKEIRKEERKNILGTSHVITYAESSCYAPEKEHNVATLHIDSMWLAAFNNCTE